MNLSEKIILMVVATAIVVAGSSCSDDLSFNNTDGFDGRVGFNISVKGGAWNAASRSQSYRPQQEVIMATAEGSSHARPLYVTVEAEPSMEIESRGTITTGVEDFTLFGGMNGSVSEGITTELFPGVTLSNGEDNVVVTGILWPKGTLNYLAYAPSDAIELYTGNNSEGEETVLPRFDFITSSEVMAQTDILVTSLGTASRETHSAGIPLTFSHALSAIKIIKSPAMDGTIHSISIKGVYDRGTYTFAGEGTGAYWTIPGDASTADYTVTFATAVNLAKDRQDGATINSDDKIFFLIPQELPDGAYIEINYHDVNNEEIIYTAPITTEDNRMTWQPGMTYSYSISLSPPHIELPFITTTITDEGHFADDTHWYYMFIAQGGFAIYGQGADETYIAVNDNHGTIDEPQNDNSNLWCFVGDEESGFTIYNRDGGVDKVLTSDRTMTGDNGGTTYVFLEAAGKSKNNDKWDFYKSTSISGETSYYMSQHGKPAYKMNKRGDKLAFWTAGADHGSAVRIRECLDIPNIDIYHVSFNKETATISTSSKYYNARALYSITLSAGYDGAQATLGGSQAGERLQEGLGSKIWIDKTGDGPIITVKRGEWITPSFDCKNSAWNHRFVYVDWEGDGFNSIEYEQGNAPDGNVVSYDYYMGHNSLGLKTEEKIGDKQLPGFVIPTNLADGIYRMRFKNDYNNLDPAGSSGSEDNVVNLPGAIVDFYIQVEGDAPYAANFDMARATTPIVANQANQRYLTSITLTGAESGSWTVGSADGDDRLQPGTGSKVWVDKTDVTPIHTFKAGETVTASFTCHKVDWSNRYLYIDLDGQGFNSVLNSSENPEGDLFTYDHYNGYNSAGDANNGSANFTTLPTFVIPASLPDGEYRVRFKCDWNNIDPRGGIDKPSGDDVTSGIVGQQGALVDFMIRVEGNATVDGE